MPPPRHGRSNSIVAQNELLESQFIPLYMKCETSAKGYTRRSPDQLEILFHENFTSKGMYIESKLMSDLIVLFNTRLMASAFLANTNIAANKNNDPAGMLVDSVDSNMSVFGIPAAKLASWGVKKAYELHATHKIRAQNLRNTFDLTVRTHGIIFSYLFALIVSPHLQNHLPSDAKEALDVLFKDKQITNVNELPPQVIKALHEISLDVMHVIGKDLSERRGPITYEDMLISALMGIPASRVLCTGSKVSPLLYNHMSSKYKADRSQPRQAAIVIVNNFLNMVGARPYNEGCSVVYLITQHARARLNSMNKHPTQHALRMEIERLRATMQPAMVSLDLPPGTGLLSRLLVSKTELRSNRQAHLHPKAEPIVSRSNNNRTSVIPTNDDDTALLRKIVSDLNAQTICSQVVEQSVDNAKQIFINNLTRVDEEVLDAMQQQIRNLEPADQPTDIVLCGVEIDPELLRDFNEQNPQVQVSIQTEPSIKVQALDVNASTKVGTRQQTSSESPISTSSPTGSADESPASANESSSSGSDGSIEVVVSAGNAILPMQSALKKMHQSPNRQDAAASKPKTAHFAADVVAAPASRRLDGRSGSLIEKTKRIIEAVQSDKGLMAPIRLKEAKAPKNSEKPLDLTTEKEENMNDEIDDTQNHSSLKGKYRRKRR